MVLLEGAHEQRALDKVGLIQLADIFDEFFALLFIFLLFFFFLGGGRKGLGQRVGVGF